MVKKDKDKIPYADTAIDPEQTKIAIKKLLSEYGIKDTQWTTFKGEDSLRFVFTVKGKDIYFEVKPPEIFAPKRSFNPKRGKYEIINFPMLSQAWRVLYWYLEVKLKAVKYGLVSLEREFLNQMLVGPPNHEITVGEIIEERLSRDQEILKLPEAPTEEEKKAIEAEYKVKGEER